MSKLHNKSNQELMGVALLNEASFERVWHYYISNYKRVKAPLPHMCGAESPCLLLANKQDSVVVDGRVTVEGKKVAYAYQLEARHRYGHDRCQLRASKRQDSLVFSHLCGTQYCVASDHIWIEPKSVNDERTHCHFAARNMLTFADGSHEAILFVHQDYGFCNHNPPCCVAKGPDEDEP